MAIKDVLPRLRRERGLTQEELAKRLYITSQAVSRWESNAAYPETDKIVRLSQLLGVSCDWLLQEGEEVSAPSGGTAPALVTRLLAQAAGRKVQLAFYDNEGSPIYDWCVIREFDGAWANVEFVKEKKDQRESRLIPLSSIRSITFVKEKGDA